MSAMVKTGSDFGSGVSPDCGLERVLRFEIAIVGDQDELLSLTDVPDLQVGRVPREPDFLKAPENKAEGLPEVGPGI